MTSVTMSTAWSDPPTLRADDGNGATHGREGDALFPPVARVTGKREGTDRNHVHYPGDGSREERGRQAPRDRVR
jgi:hypothetical protein